MAILIVDNDEIRAKNNAQSFIQSNLVEASVYIICQQKILRASDYQEVDDFDCLHPFLVALVHNNNWGDWQLVFSRKENLFKSTSIIRYTGDYQINLYKDTEYWITRSVSINRPITIEEANDIVNYFECCQNKSQLSCDNISVLSNLSLPIYLPSLSILCQGYLATISRDYTDTNSDSENDLVKKALKEMGWNTFKDSTDYAAIIHTDLLEKESETKQTSWWLEPFAPMTIDDIHKQIVKEWNKNQYSKTCDHVCQLLQALKQNTIEDPTIVANAYLAISNRLAQE